jgi:hypothetical protein
MKTTFTLEALAGMTDEKLGATIRSRAVAGALFEVVTLDQAIGRIAAASGATVTGLDLPAPIEVESRYPAPTPAEIDELLADVVQVGYASEAADVVEGWIEQRYGVVGKITAEERAETALRNVDTVPEIATTHLARGLREGRLAVVSDDAFAPESFTLRGEVFRAKAPTFVVDVPPGPAHTERLAATVAAGLAEVVTHRRAVREEESDAATE